MMTNEQITKVQKRSADFLTSAGFVLTDEEKTNIEIADFALDDLDVFTDPDINRVQ